MTEEKTLGDRLYDRLFALAEEGDFKSEVYYVCDDSGSKVHRFTFYVGDARGDCVVVIQEHFGHLRNDFTVTDNLTHKFFRNVLKKDHVLELGEVLRQFLYEELADNARKEKEAFEEDQKTFFEELGL